MIVTVLSIRAILGIAAIRYNFIFRRLRFLSPNWDESAKFAYPSIFGRLVWTGKGFLFFSSLLIPMDAGS